MNDPNQPGAPIGASHIATAREALRNMGDHDLVLAMRADDEMAWSEFVERARRVLTATARRLRFDPDEQINCGDGLLARLAAHLADPGAAIPHSLAGYIAHAAMRCRSEHLRNRFRQVAVRRRAVREEATLDIAGGHNVVASILSDYTRRTAHGTTNAEFDGDGLVNELANRLLSEMRPIDVQILAWHAASVPHRTIAEWLSLSPAAVAKRVQRLLRDTRTRFAQRIAMWSPSDQTTWQQQWRMVSPTAHPAPASKRTTPVSRPPPDKPPAQRPDEKTSE